MPKDGRGKKTGKAKPGKGDAPLADRVARLRAQIESLSKRLASAEETLIAAGGVALAKGESRMSRLLELTDAAGARLEAELGAAVEALFERSPSDSRKAPGPAPAAPAATPAPAPRPAPARGRKKAASSATRPATGPTRSTPRKATPRKSTPRKRTPAAPASTPRATPARSTGKRTPRTPSTGTTRGAGAPSSRRGRRTPPTPPA
jgi:hypothetical protein